MADDFGTGVTRVLDPKKTQITQVVWQKGKPPLDSELNYIQQLSNEAERSGVLRGSPSGWLGNGTNDSEAFLTNPAWSNWFRFGQQRGGEEAAIQWAAVNGWLIPVTGTQTGTPPGSPDDASTWNRVTLSPPPSNSGDARVDFAFLEVWQALLPPDPSSTNKPSSSAIYRYGNVEGGMSFLPDNMKDPEIGFETTQRVQVQYRIRVVTGLVGLQSFPDGFDPANVKAWGATTTNTAFTFENMREELGDPGLWRAGDGTPNSLGTVDGYSYAIPLAAVFRRNSVAWDGDPGQNLNGGFNRNPTAIDRTGWKTFSTSPTLAADIDDSQLTLTLSSATNIPLPASPSTPVLIQVGDEVMSYTSITGTTVTLSARGQLSTKAEAHFTGEEIRVVSGRPDGLFSDQIAKTDILDLRHVVSPGGFDYHSILHSNLDKLLRGDLHSNWKRSGGGPQGSFVFYQDKVSASPAALGVSKLDSPDGIRQVWSDSSVFQPLDFIATPPAGTGATEDVTTTWDLQLSGTCDNTGGASDSFKNNAVITIPISQFKTTVPGSDQDQVSFPNHANTSTDQWVKVRLAGADADLDPDSEFSVSLSSPDPDGDLQITLTTGGAIDVPLYISFFVQYGAGRGMSRRPDAVHSVSYLNSSSGTYLRQKGTSANNIPVSTAWAPLWSKVRGAAFNGAPPVTAESYIDPGSKTVVLSPFRQVELPDVSLPNDATAIMALRDTVPSLHGGEGVMPNPASKWGATTDPLGLFSTTADPTTAKKDTYFILPRNLMPSWGDYHIPVIHTDSGTLVEGINFGFDAPKGNFSAGTSVQNNFVAHAGGADSKSFATFTTVDLTTTDSGTGTNTASTFNALSSSAQGATPAGMRFYTDPNGVREGLELPPFMGVARLFAVYEADDFAVNGSAYDDVTRVATGSGATNLLRQNVEGPTMWVTMDSDGDSTFVLNAEAIDITKSPNAIAEFSAGHYVIETSVFGFDRGAFDLSDECRIVLPRTRPDALDPASGGIGAAVNSAGVFMAIPAPPQPADSIAVNYSRVPYQGDAFLSQNNGQDVAQLVGPLQSSDAHVVSTTELDQDILSRPNEKVLEVVASMGFMTSLGTGRLSGDFDSSDPNTVRFFNPGQENISNYPPATAVDDRPLLEVGSSLSAVEDLFPLGTEYHGCTTRLPLGALYRDKDFRGQAVLTSSISSYGVNPSPLMYVDLRSPGIEATSLGVNTSSEQFEALVNTTSQASGGPGEIIVHVDGETGSLNDLDNYRTTRGGSAYKASGPRPGGELSSVFSHLPSASHGNSVLAGVAYLVRNAPTSIGATEVSAGSELMLLIATSTTRHNLTSAVPVRLLCGTNGSGEGFSAADLFRCEGRPIESDSVRVGIDPSEVALTPKVSLKPRIGG